MGIPTFTQCKPKGKAETSRSAAPGAAAATLALTSVAAAIHDLFGFWLQLGDACAKLVQALVEAIRHKLSRLVLGFSDQLTDL